MADNKYTNAIKDVKTEINAIIALMKKLDEAILNTANTAKTIGPAFKVSSPEGLTNVLKEQTYLMKLFSQQIDDQTKKMGTLTAKKRRLVDLSMQEKITTRESIKALKLQATANNKLIGAYTRLAAQQKIAKNNLRDLISAEKQNVAQIKKAQREYDRLTQRVNKANKATSNFSKTGLGGMVRGFKNLLGAFGIIGGASLFASVVKDIFQLTKKMQSLNFALSTVIPNQEKLARTQEFLRDITKKYGADLITTTERYTKFVAAANQSGLELRKTEQIFRSVTKASGVLGLKTDELTGIYLALEQMLSKGKVTTEELRRQLGERLPGAMGIMAKAVGVSIVELDKMLKKGEVLSAEVLPKFAEELEKAYGITEIENIETIVAAQTRLNNAWVAWVENVTGDDGGTALIRVFDALAEALDRGADRTDRFLFIFQEGLSLFDRWKIGVNVSTKTLKELIPWLDASTGLFEESTTALIEDTKQRRLNSIEIARQNKLFVALYGSLRPFTEEQQKLFDDLQEPFSLYRSEIRRTKEVVQQELKEQNDLLKNATAEEADAILDVIEVLKKELKQWERNSAVKKKILSAEDGSIGYYKALIKQLEDEQSKLAVNTDLWRGYAMAIDQAKENLSDIESKFDISLLSGEKVDTKGLLPTPEESYASAEKVFQAITKAEEERAEKTKEINDGIRAYEEEKDKNAAQARAERIRQSLEIFETISAEFSDYFDIDIDKFKFLFNELDNTVAQWADASKEAISAVLEASLQRYEIELQEAQRSRDLIIDSDLASEKEKRIARQRFEREEREIKTRRAKAERDNALIQVAVDTASGIAKTIAQVGLPAAFPLIGVLTGIGLLQAGIIAAQPLPKFAEGTNAPLQADTLAWVGDAYRKEAITKDGKLLGISPDKPTLAHLPKGAEVHKDAYKYLNENEINNAVFKMNMASDGNALSEKIIDTALLSEVGKLRLETKKTWTEVKKLASRSVNVKNKVIIEKEYEY